MEQLACRGRDVLRLFLSSPCSLSCIVTLCLKSQSAQSHQHCFATANLLLDSYCWRYDFLVSMGHSTRPQHAIKNTWTERNRERCEWAPFSRASLQIQWLSLIQAHMKYACTPPTLNLAQCFHYKNEHTIIIIGHETICVTAVRFCVKRD